MQGSAYLQTMRYGHGLGNIPLPYGTAPQAGASCNKPLYVFGTDHLITCMNFLFLPLAVMHQQMGGSIPGLTLPFSSQAGLQMTEDPSLYVNFDDEDSDFPNGRRIAVTYPQQPQKRPGAATAQINPPIHPSTSSASLPQSRPASTGATKSANAADQELADLKRRIAEKEKQMQAKRQSVQGNAGTNTGASNIAKFNPAHGPVLRGLHRKQSSGIDKSNEQQVDSFLKEIAADLPAKPTGIQRELICHLSAMLCQT